DVDKRQVKHENFVPVRLADQEIRPMGHLNGTAGFGREDYDRYNDLWCIGQNSTEYLDEIDGSAQHNVIKSVYDPCPPEFMVPPNRAFDKLNPEDGGGKWVEMFTADETGYYSFGRYEFSEFNLVLPAMPYLSSRMGGGGESVLYQERVPQCDRIEELRRDGYPDVRYCFPMEETLFGNSCSLWTADITNFTGGNFIGGSIYNITGNFVTRPAAVWGSNGPTAQEATDPRPASGFGWSCGARQIRPVREK
ncbi:MAG: hypothetical protein K2G09_04880, partial [Paramuribaculum sp.]|nr:hypothetical protein [Paramuribaculum sp.]